MENYNTLLIFGYGQTQLITDIETKIVESDNLIFLNAVIKNVYANKPIDNKSSNEFTRITIYNADFADWINSNPDDYFKVAYSELNKSLIDSLVLEIKNK
jgi:pectate lyase